MKIQHVEKKLFLNKKTVANLENREMITVKGGSKETVEACDPKRTVMTCSRECVNDR